MRIGEASSIKLEPQQFMTAGEEAKLRTTALVGARKTGGFRVCGVDITTPAGACFSLLLFLICFQVFLEFIDEDDIHHHHYYASRDSCVLQDQHAAYATVGSGSGVPSATEDIAQTAAGGDGGGGPPGQSLRERVGHASVLVDDKKSAVLGSAQPQGEALGGDKDVCMYESLGEYSAKLDDVDNVFSLYDLEDEDDAYDDDDDDEEEVRKYKKSKDLKKQKEKLSKEEKKMRKLAKKEQKKQLKRLKKLAERRALQLIEAELRRQGQENLLLEDIE